MPHISSGFQHTALLCVDNVPEEDAVFQCIILYNGNISLCCRDKKII